MKSRQPQSRRRSAGSGSTAGRGASADGLEVSAGSPHAESHQMKAEMHPDKGNSRLETLGRLVENSPAVLFLSRIKPGNWPVEAVSAGVQNLLGYSADGVCRDGNTFSGDPRPVCRAEGGGMNGGLTSSSVRRPTAFDPGPSWRGA